MTVADLFRDVLRTLWAQKAARVLDHVWHRLGYCVDRVDGGGRRRLAKKAGKSRRENLGKDVMIVFHGRTSLQAGGTHGGPRGALGRR